MKMMKKMLAALSAAVVAGLSVASFTASAAVDWNGSDEGPYGAYLCFQVGGDALWTPDGSGNKDTATNVASVEFTGDGQYTVSATVANGSGTIELLLLETNINAYAFAPEGASITPGSLPTDCTANITIDEVRVDQVAGSSQVISYGGPSDGALRCSDNGSTIRVNMLNTWTTPSVSDIPSDLSSIGGLAAGDTIVVTFTVSGINAGGGTAETTAPAENSQGDTTTSPAGGGADDTTTAAATNADGTPATTAASGASTNANNNNRNSNSNNSSSNSGSSNNTSTVSETSDFGVAAVVLGAVAAASLGVGAYTITRRKK